MPRPPSVDPETGAGVRVRLFVMDVDGTLTDGTITYAEDGTEWKSFHARDGMGINLLPLADIVPAIVTGRRSEIVARRSKELGITEVHQGVKDKAGLVRSLRDRLGVEAAEVAYVGDDLSDLPPMREAGWSAAPADSAPEVRRAATFVCSNPGGRGAVREAIEALLQREGRWEAVLHALEGAAKASL
jgi:3-deoxy-D-manno-octulosonate 8-phosphate phosphatase (KDO 8-P phosphatase)